MTIEGQKTWDDEGHEDMRPESISIYLLANGEVVASKDVTAGDGWKWEFTNLPSSDDAGRITYTVTEEALNGYVVTYDGFAIRYEVSTADADGDGCLDCTRMFLRGDKVVEGMEAATFTNEYHLPSAPDPEKPHTNTRTAPRETPSTNTPTAPQKTPSTNAQTTSQEKLPDTGDPTRNDVLHIVCATRDGCGPQGRSTSCRLP